MMNRILSFLVCFFLLINLKVNAQPIIEIIDQGTSNGFDDLISNSCMSDLDASAILEKYWKLRNDLKKDFINYSSDDLLNLENDGIGDFDTETCMFEHSGTNLPAYSLDLNNNGPDVISQDFTRHFGDTQIRMGQLIANTCMEYALFSKIDDEENKQIALNKVFLLLQTIRRLDMLANKYMEIFYTECGNTECPEFEADMSGYSGFMLRDDVLWENDYDNDTYTVSNNISDYVRKWNLLKEIPVDINDPEGPKIATGNPSELCSLACFFPEWSTQQFINGNPFPINLAAGEINNVISQDQLIGVLQGLVYVKRFIPESATVTVGGQSHNVFDIAFNIALGIKEITNACSNNIKYPGCQHCDDLRNVPRGEDTGPFYYGIAHAVEYITGISANTTWSENTQWGVAGGWTSATGITQKHNVRMYNKLSVYGNVNTNSETLDDALSTGNLVTPLELILLHGNYDAFNNDLNPFDDGANEWRDRYCELITSLDCEGPCNLDGFIQTDIECSQNDLWCSGQPLENNLTSYNFISGESICPDQQAIYSPLEYLYMVSLLLVTDVLDATFVDPASINTKIQDGISIIGPSVLCEGDVIVYQFHTDVPFGEFEFCTSENIEIVSVNGDEVTVELIDYSIKEGIICVQEILPIDEDCALPRKIYKKVSITEDEEYFNIDEHVYGDPCTRVIEVVNFGLINNDFEISEFSFIGVDGPLGEIYTPNGAEGNSILMSYYPENDQMAKEVRYIITFDAGCLGIQTITGVLDFTECVESDNIMKLVLSPNPLDPEVTDDKINVQIINENQTNGSPATIKGALYVIPPNFGQSYFIKEVNSNTGFWEETIDLPTNMNDGIGYILFIRNNGESVNSPFVIQRR